MTTPEKQIEGNGTGTATKPNSPDRMKRIDGIIEKYNGDPKALLSILLELQSEFNHLSKTAMIRVSR